MSGIDFEKLPDAERRRMGALPAMIYHGVNSEDAVLMRMNAAPRSAAERLGEMYRRELNSADDRYSSARPETTCAACRPATGAELPLKASPCQVTDTGACGAFSPGKELVPY